MNNWTSGYCYSPARTLPSLQSLLFGACSSAEHGLSDRMSEVGQRGVGAQVLLSGSSTEKEWPVSANAPSVCLRSFLRCPCALFLQWLPCWHKDLPFAQMADSRGPPHTFYVSEVLPPWVCLRCSFGPYAQLRRMTRAERWASVLPKTTKVNRCIKTSDLLAAFLLQPCLSYFISKTNVISLEGHTLAWTLRIRIHPNTFTGLAVAWWY